MSGTVVDRRAFLRVSARACGALASTGAVPAASWGAEGAESLRIGLLGPVPEDAARGATLGIEEAARTGVLIGRAIELRTVDTSNAEALVREWRPAALVGGFGEAVARAGAALAGTAGVAFLNAGSRADSLRGEACARAVFHVEASEAMYRAALAAGGELRATELQAGTRAALWYPGLERFGAEQLNARFRARYAAGMGEAAWASWMAVKVLWEASLRARSTHPAPLLEYLARESTQFDGHKGWRLSFRRWDHQLRQPLYLLNGEGDAARLIGEVPTRPQSDELSSRELLDRLGASATTTPCRGIPEGA